MTTSRTLRTAQLHNLVELLRQHGYTVTDIARCIGRDKAHVHKTVCAGTIGAELIGDIEAVLIEAEIPLPENLWLTRSGADLAATRRRLRSLRTGDLIAPQYAALCTTPPRRKHKNKENTVQPLTLETMEHFGLTRDPFRNEIRSRGDLYITPEYERMAETIATACKRSDFIAFTARVGAGKTQLMREVKARLPKTVRFVEPQFPGKRIIDSNNLLDAILLELSADDKQRLPSRRESKARTVLRVLEAQEQDRQSTVLYLDEAHDYSKSAVRELKRLYEMQTGFSRLLGIILVGQDPELSHRLADATLREVTQRCGVHRLNGLGKHAEAYLRHKFDRAGIPLNQIFDDSGLKSLCRVCTLSDGSGPMPQFLGIMASLAMNLAAENGHKLVNDRIIDMIRPPAGTQETR